jgi:hypothetical protein
MDAFGSRFGARCTEPFLLVNGEWRRPTGYGSTP